MDTWLGGVSWLADWEPQHTYAEAGNYTLTLGAGYADSTTGSFNYFDTQTRSITVEDAAPTVNLAGDAATVTDLEYDCSAVFTDPGSNDIPDQWTLNWGDGTSTLYLGNVTAFSHVYKRNSVGGNGATFNVTAAAHTDDGDFNGTTMVAVGKPMLDVIKNDGTALDEHTAQTRGGFVTVNTNNDGVQFDPSGNAIPDNEQTGSTDGNDPDLVPVRLDSVSAAVGGTYVLTWDTSDVRVWKDPLKQAEVANGSTEFDAAAATPTTVYVEGMRLNPKLGGTTLNLVWKNAAKNIVATFAKLPTGEIEGAAYVPAYGAYTYSIRSALAGTGWSATGGTVSAGSGGHPLADVATVTWDQPAAGNAGWAGTVVYSPAAGFSIRLPVRVFRVTVTTPANGFTPGAPADDGNGNTDTHGNRAPWSKRVISDPVLGLGWKAAVTVAGPQDARGNAGVGKLTIGFVQNVTQFTEQGDYAGNLSRHFYAQRFFALGPVLDGDPTTKEVWYRSKNNPRVPSTFTPSIGMLTQTIGEGDRPGGYAPLDYEKDNDAVAVSKSDHPLQSITLTNGFRLYVCARTSDQANGADKVYVSEASADWSFDGSGDINNRFAWSGRNAAVTPPPNGWAASQGGTPVTTGIKADILASKGSFN